MHNIFQGLKIALDISATKERQKWSNIIKEHGGDISFLSTKCNFLVTTPPKDKPTNSKIDIAQKMKVVVVTTDYLMDCVEHQRVESTENYIITTNRANWHITNLPEKAQGEIAAHKYAVGDSNSPYFPNEDYEILNSAIFQKEHLFGSVELNIGGQAISEVNTMGTPETRYEKTYFRIFIHSGDSNDMVNSKKECAFPESLHSAENMYSCVFEEFVNSGYTRVQLVSSNIGSDKVQRAGSTGASMVSPEVTSLVSMVYEEAAKQITAMVAGQKNEKNSQTAPGGVTLSPEGHIASPLGQISIHQVEKGEIILLQINELVKEDSPDQNEKNSLTKEFYSVIPRQQKVEITTSNIQLIMDDVQLVKDLLSVGESLGTQMGLSEMDIRYRAMRCEITHVEESTEEYSSVTNFVRKSMNKQDSLTVKNIYKLYRDKEKSTFTNAPNQQMLFHGTRAAHILGILSRGILLPNVAASSGSNRTDQGMLGAGIYFSPDASASAKYCTPSASGSRFLLVCNVGLGSVKRFITKQPHLTNPPEGYDSVRGVKSGTLNHNQELATEFLDDEFVVYSTNQFYLTHLIEFCDERTVPLEVNGKEFASLNDTLKISPVEEKLIDEAVPDEIQRPVSEKPFANPGLLAVNGKKMPLCSVHVSAKLIGMVGEVVVLQHYHNDSDVAIEAKYVFPLDEMATVCGFEAFINGKHIIGKVQEKTQAHREYKEAISQGHGAYLIDEEKPDVFTVTIGNLPPKSDVIIKVRYVTELSIEEGKIVFTIPCTVAPVQAERALREQKLTELAKIGAVANNYGFTLEVAVEMASDIEFLKGVSHDIYTKITKSKATITLAKKHTHLSKDFELHVGVKDVCEPRMWVEVDEKGTYASMLSFYPQFSWQEKKLASELLILVDRSCSMKGEAMQDLKRVLRVLISHLRDQGTPFNIIEFGSSSTWPFNSSVSGNDDLYQKAWTHVNSMKANFGSTDLHAALKLLFIRANSDSQRNTNIFLFTDGHAMNNEDLLPLVRRNAKHARLFTFGIGATPARHFIRALARAGNGYAEFITPNKIPNPNKVLSQIKRACQPSISSVEVKFDSDGSITQAPAKISSIFCGERQIVYAFAGSCTRATLTAIAPGGGQISSSAYTPETAFLKGSMIHRLAARAIIRDHQDGMISTIPHFDDLLKRTQKNWIIELSIEHSILSQYTSFIVIEPREANEVAAKNPNFMELIQNESVDELKTIEWHEIADETRKEEQRQEVRIEHKRLFEAAKEAKNRNCFKDAIVCMYKLGMSTSELKEFLLPEAELLWECTENVLKDSLEKIKIDKEKNTGPRHDSFKAKRLRKAIQDEVSRFVAQKEKFPKKTIESEILLAIAESRCFQYLSEVNAANCDGKAHNLLEKTFEVAKKALHLSHPLVHTCETLLSDSVAKMDKNSSRTSFLFRAERLKNDIQQAQNKVWVVHADSASLDRIKEEAKRVTIDLPAPHSTLPHLPPHSSLPHPPPQSTLSYPPPHPRHTVARYFSLTPPPDLEPGVDEETQGNFQEFSPKHDTELVPLDETAADYIVALHAEDFTEDQISSRGTTVEQSHDTTKEDRIRDEEMRMSAQELQQNLACLLGLSSNRKRDESKNAESSQSMQELREKFERDIANLKGALEDEKRTRSEQERVRQRLEAENDELNNKLDQAMGSRMKTEKAKKKLDLDLRATKNLLEESTTKTQSESPVMRLEEEVAILKQRLESEENRSNLLLRTNRSWELQLEDARTQMEIEARQRASADKMRRKAELELEDLREQLDIWEDASSLEQLDHVDLVKSLKDDLLKEKRAHAETEELVDSLREELSRNIENETLARCAISKSQKSLEAQVDQLSEENERKSVEVAELQKKLAEGADREAKLREMHKKFDKDIENLISGLAEEQHGRQEVARKCMKLTYQLDELQIQLKNAGQNKADEEKRKDFLIGELKKELKQLNENLAIEIKKKNLLEEKCRSLEITSDDAEMQSKLYAWYETERDLREKVGNLAKSERALRAENDELRDQLDEMIAENDHAHRGQRKLEQQLEELRTQLDEQSLEDEERKIRKEIEVEQLKRKLNEAEELVRTLRAENELRGTNPRVAQVRDLEKETDELKKEIEELKRKLSDAEKIARALRAECDELRGQIGDSVHPHYECENRRARQVRALEVEIEELKDQLDELEEQLLEAEDKGRRNGIEIEELKFKIKEQESIIYTLRTENTELRSREDERQFTKDDTGESDIVALGDSSLDIILKLHKQDERKRLEVDRQLPDSDLEESGLETTPGENYETLPSLMTAHPLLRKLSFDTRFRIATAMTRHCLSAGEYAKDVASRFFLIETGSVEVRTKNRKNGNEEVTILGSSKSFGEPQKCYAIESARARSTCVLWILDNPGKFLDFEWKLYEEYAKVLSRVNLLKPLTEYERLLVAYTCDLKWEEIVQNEQILDHFYVIVSGSLEVTIDGKTSILSALNCFGESQIFANQTADFDVVATTPSVLLAIGKSDFVQYISAPN